MSHPQPAVYQIEKRFIRAQPLPDFRPGDSVRVQVRIREGEKERLQAFEGIVTRRAKGGVRGTFTVRKISYGVGVERVFPENSPNVASVEILNRGKVRRARLYYLRELSGKAARIKERTSDQMEDMGGPEAGAAEAPAEGEAVETAAAEAPAAAAAPAPEADKKRKRKDTDPNAVEANAKREAKLKEKKAARKEAKSKAKAEKIASKGKKKKGDEAAE